MGVNIFVTIRMPKEFQPSIDNVDVSNIVNDLNERARGRFDWCDVFKGPGGHVLTLEEALAFSEDEAPWWVVDKYKKLIKVKHRGHWQQLLRNSGCQHVIFLKARL